MGTLTKVDAAFRMTNAAIRMLFLEFDPLAARLLSSSAYQCLRDLGKHCNLDFHNSSEIWIKPDKLKEFYAAVNGPANFLKHADREPDALIDTDKIGPPDFDLVMCCAYLEGLGAPKSPEISVYRVWFTLMYPNTMTDSARWLELAGSLNEPELHTLQRSEQLKLGQVLLREGYGHAIQRIREHQSVSVPVSS